MNEERTIKPILAAFALATVTACGGGGGGGGSTDDDGGGGGDTSGSINLDDGQQATLAAKSAAGITSAASGMSEAATSQTDDQVDNDSTSGVVAGATTTEDCGTSGSIIRDTGTASVTFPSSAFSGGEVDGAREAYLADCTFSSDTNSGEFKGQLEYIADDLADGDGGNEWAVFRAGGANAIEGSPNLDEAYRMESSFTFEGDTTEFLLEATSEMHVCIGCVDGDLSDFSGVEENMTMLMYADWNFNGSSWEVGESRSDKLLMQATASGGETGRAEVEVDGRMAFIDTENDGCGFDVTYDFSEGTPLIVNDFVGSPETVGGEFELTVNETGEIYNVQVSSEGNVTVRDSSGGTVDVDDDELSNVCPEEA